MKHQKSRSRELPWIRFVHGLRTGEQIFLVEKTSVIGRDPSADIQLESPFVSRRHAEIALEGIYWNIEDLYSKNGVFRNLSRIQPGRRIPLNHRDQIQIGSVSTFELYDPEATVHQSDVRLLIKGLWLDQANRDVNIWDRRLDPPLSPQQFALLSALVQKGGDVVSNEEIAQVLWPDAAGGVESAAIDNVISRLRDRMAELDKAHDYIETLRGVGRRFVPREQDE